MTSTFLNICLDLKDKFKAFFIAKKKLTALTNFSEAVPNSHRSYLTLLKKCANDSCLGEKEADFLTYMIDLYEINYLDWSHKTNWLKAEIKARKAEARQARRAQLEMPMFDFDKKREIKVPENFVPMQPSFQQVARRL